MMELWSLLTGEESYQERAQEYRELQMELEYYEGSASAGMFDSLVSHVGHEIIGIANTAISASNAFWKAVHWFNIPAKLYGLEAPETELISTAPFDTYLEKNAARIWDMDVYYAGRCGGDMVIGAVDLAAMVKGLANLPGALEDLLNGIGFLSGGSPQLQLVGGSAQAAAGGSVALGGVAGIARGSIPALLLGDAGEDFLRSFAKIDRDRLFGSEGGPEAGNWNKGSFDSPEDSLEYHFGKHGNEVGATSRDQYLRKAQEFAKTAKKGSIKSRVNGAVEGTIRYKKNGKYIDIAPWFNYIIWQTIALGVIIGGIGTSVCNYFQE